ncbi:MAG: crossover junction endodeoxyribonuclease RuvC [Leptonema sp. (in: bacteria)]
MIRIGVDPGLEKTGFAILNEKNQLLHIGTIETKKEMKVEIRLKNLFHSFKGLLESYHIELLLIEKIISTKTIITNLEKILQARGCILTLAGIQEISVVEIHPKVVKKSIAGNGNATKETIKTSLTKIFGYDLKNISLTDDSIDALAIALSYSTGPFR